MKLNKSNIGRINHQASSVLNVLDLPDNDQPFGPDNVPKGLREDGYSPTSSNFGTPRDSVKAGALVGNGSMFISISGLLATDSIEYTGGDIVAISDGRIDIPNLSSLHAFKVIRGGSEIGFYKLTEKSGNTLHDVNGNHGSIQNPYEGMWGEHNGYSYADEEGYGLLGEVKIPAKTPTTDIFDNPLTYLGKVPSKAEFVESPCLLGDGTIYLSGDVLTTDVISAGTGSSTPTCTINGRLDFANGEKYWDISIERGGSLHARLPLSEEIIDPSNHTYYDVS